MARLIDADALFNSLEASKRNLIQIDCNDGAIDGLNMAQISVQIAPTIEFAPVSPNPCGFCGKFDFGDARAEVYRNGANLVFASALAKFPVDEQFNFCPVCGRNVKKGGAK